MNWKKCLIACISLVCLIFPYNIIGCAGGDADPYDYFVSFFSKNNTGVKGYEPFYYTNYRFLYEDEEPVNVADVTSAEWVSYGNNSFTAKDAYAFVCQYARKDLSNLYFNLEKNQPLQIPDSVKNNGMTKFFMTGKDLEALGYIMYAKQVEPNVTGNWSEWEPIERDAEKMGKLIKNGQQLHAVAKNNAIKLRLAYQVLRLAHYSKRYAECLQWYDELVKPNPTPGVLQDLCLGLKAGSLMRTGKKEEAAYIFSQLFSKNQFKRVSNYMSFDWCVSRFEENNRTACLALCKTNEDRANMLGLFALGSNKEELPALKKIIQLSPKASLLEILTLREIHKLEEYYLTPALQFQAGKQEASINYNTINRNDPSFLAWQKEGKDFAAFCQQAANVKGADKGFYTLAAAHAALISADYANARKLLDDAKKQNLSLKLQDQCAMTNLLLTINTKPALDAALEAELMPSIQWLEKKSITDEEYARFYRRLLADVLAPKYQPNNKLKQLLSIGTSQWISSKYIHSGWGSYGNGDALTMLRYELTAQQVEQLVQFMESTRLTPFEKYLVSHNAFSKDDVNDVAGTAFLRQFDFAAAEKWFTKVSPAYYKSETYTTYLAGNPFADLIEDTHAPTAQDTKKYTKLTFAHTMLGLEQEIKTNKDPEKLSKAYYEMAKGLYQMSYWGNSWLLVSYSWSGNDGLKGANDMQPGDKEYFGVYKAEEYYMKAFGLTQDKNFKARCLFMAAKCDQKQIPVPTYSQFKDYNDYDKAQVAYARKIKTNAQYFPQLVKDYSATPFYKQAFNTCSYLQDFVKKK